MRRVDAGEAGFLAALHREHRLRLVGIDDRHPVDWCALVVARGGVHDVVGAEHQRDVGLRHLGVDFVHLHQCRVRDVRLGKQHVHVAGHAARHRVDGELHDDAAFGERVVQLPHLVLRLRHRHPVTRNDHHVARLLEQLRGSFDRLLLPLLLLTSGEGRLRFPEGAEQDIRERAVHRATHDDRENQAARAVQRAGRHEQLAVEHESHRHRR